MHKRYLKIVGLIFSFIALGIYGGFVYENHKADSHHHDHSDHYHEHTSQEIVIPSEKLLFPSRDPDRVILNLTENPETSIAVNWRTDTTVTSGTVEWALATSGPEFLNSVKKVTAKMEFDPVTPFIQP